MNQRLADTLPKSIPLGKKTTYPTRYDKGQLEPVSRANQRSTMGFDPSIPMVGRDIWNAFEVSWLNPSGVPKRALATFIVPSDSPFIAESKSVKLYLNSFNAERLAESEVINRIREDISQVCQAPVLVSFSREPFLNLAADFKGYFCLDDLEVEISCYERNSSLLKCEPREENDQVFTHAFKSHCLVTDQPDWGSIFISYEGAFVERASLLKYLVSYHTHRGFSENCIEQIYIDLMTVAKPKKLSVFGRFTRRGGIDINPYRANYDAPLVNFPLEL